ncbi:helix-turn-helix transcriptional regulator [Agromyces marinus]|uniref:Helix-turn-helix domain-containing protein n=1 Tax=Agromyces marinus TaxID=1389020 RepID=A0ABM8H5K6_9MICO|nr:helix-turn-helix domain-containing protein [Agromyces marinus]UIP58958.1 hypothetical protein DSM26151_18480 [Agromyces marinus]BDZ56076.1 hypothetical protein GCM10025870_31490 [Agromyces marinus]
MNETTTTTAPVLLTQHELAELLQMPERTLEDWRLRSSGPAFLKIGRHVRYEFTDVLAWLGEHRHA